VSLETLESEGLRMLDLARSVRPLTSEDVETDSQPLDSSSDRPIETEAAPIPPGDPDSPDDSETPDLKEPEVEGAVT
jgi:hypothetical protein